MDIEYKTRAIERVCTDAAEARRKRGLKMAEKISQRIQEIRSVDSVETMLKFHIGRCHVLHGDRNGLYAVDLVHPYRLVFENKETSVHIVKIVEIVDYH